MTIYKYPIKVTDRQTVSIPGSAKLLTVQVQNGIPCVWAHIRDESDLPRERTLVTYGTGHPAPLTNMDVYLGTYQLEGGALVFHVFEVRS